MRPLIVVKGKGKKMLISLINNEILTRADKVVYTTERYYYGCMLKRNRHLVDISGYCICYLKRDKGGTAYTVNCAKQNDLIIYNIAENTF